MAKPLLHPMSSSSSATIVILPHQKRDELVIMQHLILLVTQKQLYEMNTLIYGKVSHLQTGYRTSSRLQTVSSKADSSAGQRQNVEKSKEHRI